MKCTYCNSENVHIDSLNSSIAKDIVHCNCCRKNFEHTKYIVLNSAVLKFYLEHSSTSAEEKKEISNILKEREEKKI